MVYDFSANSCQRHLHNWGLSHTLHGKTPENLGQNKPAPFSHRLTFRRHIVSLATFGKYCTFALRPDTIYNKGIGAPYTIYIIRPPEVGHFSLNHHHENPPSLAFHGAGRKRTACIGRPPDSPRRPLHRHRRHGPHLPRRHPTLRPRAARPQLGRGGLAVLLRIHL